MSRHKVKLLDLENQNKNKTYVELYEYIMSKISAGELKPIKASGLNGKKPALYNTYWKCEEENDYSEIVEEMTYRINPVLDMSYYKKYPINYIKDREYIMRLSEYLSNNSNTFLEHLETINERSFEIFYREKYLKEENGLELLKKLNYSKEKLNYYETTEPLSYYAHNKNTPQNLLIIENKDTFYSMRKYLIEGNENIMGLKIGTLIYGGGKSILKSFEDYINGVEPYFSNKENKVYYFGDIDYEGISIYESLIARYNKVEINVFKSAYERMLLKAMDIGIESLPTTKSGQKEREGKLFFSQFDKQIEDKIRNILNVRKYIPQEIVNQNDYKNIEYI